MTIVDTIPQRKGPSGPRSALQEANGVYYIKEHDLLWAFGGPPETQTQSFYVYNLDPSKRYAILPNPQQYSDDAWPPELSFSHVRALTGPVDMNSVDAVAFPNPGVSFGLLVEVGMSLINTLIGPQEWTVPIDLGFFVQEIELAVFTPAPAPPPPA